MTKFPARFFAPSLAKDSTREGFGSRLGIYAKGEKLEKGNPLSKLDSKKNVPEENQVRNL